jgi:hypothetical protein
MCTFDVPIEAYGDIYLSTQHDHANSHQGDYEYLKALLLPIHPPANPRGKCLRRSQDSCMRYIQFFNLK